MDWIHDYQLFLFDFDGLLVNTEETHYLAYKLCALSVGSNSTGILPAIAKQHIMMQMLFESNLKQFPQLHTIEPHWPVLYAEKKQALCNLVNEGAIHLMPGV